MTLKTNHFIPVCTLLFCFFWVMGGCAAKNTFVLLPDPDGRVGEITVSTQEGSQVVTRADHAVTVSSAEEPPQKPRKMDPGIIQEKFGSVLKAEPEPPVTFSLYFISGTDQLTAKSQERIPDILSTISKRKSKDISVTGHTDRVGAEDLNYRLSRNRANTIRDLLINEGVPSDTLFTEAHGENNPLVPTEDEIPEPRNRRVDVTIR